MGGDHGHGHGPPYTVPDYKIYKIENCPDLVELQAKLAEKGLKDPWLRNEAWRFDRSQYPTFLRNCRTVLTRGVGTGIVLTALTVLIGNLTAEKDHGHHEEHH